MTGDVEAIIEQERTKRARLRSHRLATLIVAAVLGAVGAIVRPEAAEPIVSIVAILVLSSLIVEYVNREGTDG